MHAQPTGGIEHDEVPKRWLALRRPAARTMPTLLLAFALTLVNVSVSVPNAAATDCADVVFIGVRGSGQTADEAEGLGSVVKTVKDSFIRKTSGKRSTLVSRVDYPARHVRSIGNPSIGILGFLEGASDGAVYLQAKLMRAVRDCDSWIVLAGFSQGNMVIRQALASLPDAIRDKVNSRIAGVALMSDPYRDAQNDADGAWHYGSARGGGGYGIALAVGLREDPLSRYRGRNISWCVENDIVCDYEVANTGPLGVAIAADLHVHAYNDRGHSTHAGEILAEDVLKLPRTPSTQAPSSTPPVPQPPAAPAPRSPAPPRQEPRLPKLYVSTCYLRGKDRCTGVYLRSVPFWPNNVVHELPEKHGISAQCFEVGTVATDERGVRSTTWLWVRGSGGREGYVNEVWVFGERPPVPRCNGLSGGTSSISGWLHRAGYVELAFPVTNVGVRPMHINHAKLVVRGPQGENLDRDCAGGRDLVIPAKGSWTCQVTLDQRPFPTGQYRAHFAWHSSVKGGWRTRSEGWTDDYWRSWTMDDRDPMQVSGPPAPDRETTLVNETAGMAHTAWFNGSNMSVDRIGHFYQSPSGDKQFLQCGANVRSSTSAFQCRTSYTYALRGDYKVWPAHLAAGKWYEHTDKVRTVRVVTPADVKVVSHSVDSPARQGEPLDVSFTVKNFGDLPATFHPAVQSSPVLYGGFGQCEGIDYTGTGAESAIVLKSGETYTCRTFDVVENGVAGPHQLFATILHTNGTAQNLDLTTLDMQPQEPTTEDPSLTSPVTAVQVVETAAARVPKPNGPRRANVPAAYVVVKGAKGKRSRLRVRLYPAMKKRNYSVLVQKRRGKGARNKWSIVRKTRTVGRKDVRTILVGKGVYRVKVPKQRNFKRSLVSNRVRAR